MDSLDAFRSLFDSRTKDILFREEWKNERLLSLFRGCLWIMGGSVYIFSDLSRGDSLSASACLAPTWGVAIFIIDYIVLRRVYYEFIPVLMGTLDIIVFSVGRNATHEQLLAMGSPIAMHQLYTVPLGLLMILVFNSLRYSWRTTAWCTFLSCVAYVSLVARHAGWHAQSYLDVFFLVSAGFIMIYGTNRIRNMLPRVMERNALARFVPGPALESISKDPEKLEMGGKETSATILFADIRGFTAMSDQVSPGEIVAWLNEYFLEMVNEISASSGIIDKFIGDGICAAFAPPFCGDNHPEQASACALGMMRRLEELNSKRAKRGQAPFRIGIGIHTGKVIAGNIGSPQRMDFTHIGDAVNTASRLEGLTKDLGEPVLVSNTTHTFIKGNSAFELRRMPPQKVKGKKEALTVFALTAPGNNK